MKARDLFDKYQLPGLVIAFILLLSGHFAMAMPDDANTIAMVDSVRAEIEKHDIEHSEIVLRQSIWETGWYKCDYCSRRYNNLFGFRHKSWVTEENPKGYLKFDTWQESVAYYKKWQTKRYSGGDYYTFLINVGYAEDGNKYVKHLKSLSV
jgi:flagellum-specific peptidoglycan hydrolase FlgJ